MISSANGATHQHLPTSFLKKRENDSMLVNGPLYQVREEEVESSSSLTSLSDEERRKANSSKTESILSDSSAFTNLTWRISSTQGEFFDDQFSSTGYCASPHLLLNVGEGEGVANTSACATPILSSNHQQGESSIQRNQEGEEDSLDCSQNSNSTITQSTSFKSNSNKTMITTADTSLSMSNFPSPPSIPQMDSPLIPFTQSSTNFHQDEEGSNKGLHQSHQIRPSSSNSNTHPDKQKRLAELRARQHALFLEEKQLEAERSPDVSNENEFGSLLSRRSPPSSQMMTEDTEMVAGETDSPRSTSFNGRSSLNRRQIPLPPQPPPPSSTAPLISPLRVNKPKNRFYAVNNNNSGVGSEHHQQNENKSSEEIASDFEMASLRAQVAQLQLALKKQMNPMMMNNNKSNHLDNIHNRLDPMNLLELTTPTLTQNILPPTPAESQAGSSEPSISRKPTTNNGNRIDHHFHHPTGMHDEYGRHYNDHNGMDHQSSLSSPTSAFSHPNQHHHHPHSVNGNLSRFASINSQTFSRPSNTFSGRTSNDTFGNSFTNSPSVRSGGGGRSIAGHHDLSFGQRSIVADDSVSYMSRPNDDRVGELSAKIDRLEELLRLTALSQSSPTVTSTRMSIEESPMYSGGGRTNSNNEYSQYTLQEHRPMNNNRMVESEVVLMRQQQEQQQHQQYHNQLHPQSQQQQHNHHGPIRTPSLASTNSSQGGLSSNRTKSPASSAFQFNATPYARYVGDQGGNSGDCSLQNPIQHQHKRRNSSLPDQYDMGMMGGGSTNELYLSGEGQQQSQSNNTKSSSSSSSSKDKLVEHIPRKGVARFILGNSTTKLIDSTTGRELPSTQLSLSFNRTERVEKLPKVKIKSAGRGRIVVKPTTNK